MVQQNSTAGKFLRICSEEGNGDIVQGIFENQALGMPEQGSGAGGWWCVDEMYE